MLLLSNRMQFAFKHRWPSLERKNYVSSYFSRPTGITLQEEREERVTAGCMLLITNQILLFSCYD